VSASLLTPVQIADPNQPADVWVILKAVAETAALFGFFTSVIGWSYLASYYSYFAFRPMELDISSPVVTLFAVSALSRTFFLVLAVAILALRLFRVRVPRLGGSSLLALLVLLTLAFYQLGMILGRYTAREDIWDTSSRLPSVGIYLSNSRLGYPSCVSTTTPTVDCRLLIHQKGIYYLIKPFIRAAQESEGSAKTIRNLEVYAIPDSQVQFVQYERGVR
jgi:hypothetical protein